MLSLLFVYVVVGGAVADDYVMFVDAAVCGACGNAGGYDVPSQAKGEMQLSTF